MTKPGFVDSSTEQNNIKMTLRPLHRFGQALGIFPDLQRKGVFKRSLLVFYALFVVFLNFYFMLYRVFVKGGTVKSRGSSLTPYMSRIQIVRGLTACNCLLFLRVSKSWPSLIDTWSRIDTDLFKDGLYNYLNNRWWICPAISLFAVFASLGQLSSGLLMIYSKLKSMPVNNGTVNFASIVQATFPQISGLIAVLWYPVGVCVYSLALLQSCLTTAFFDCFLMVVSLNLASRLKRLTRFAKAVTTCVIPKPEEFWSNIRRNYSRLGELVSSIDDQISPIILCYYLQIIVCLLTMLTTFLMKSTTSSEKLYCFCAGFRYCTLLILLSLFSARINEESTEILRTINSMPTDDYSNEVEKLLQQISFDDVVLTGFKMFDLKKSLILKVINAVVSYELIVIQYLENTT